MLRVLILKLIKIPSWLWRKLLIWVNRLRFALYGIRFGEKLMVVGSPALFIEQNSKVSFGDECVISNGGVNPLCVDRRTVIFCKKGACISVGNHCGFSSTTFFIFKSLSIGSNVLVGGNVVFMDTDAHSLDWRIRRDWHKDSQCHEDKGIVVGDDTFIGMDTTILKGVHIGSRVVIGAGSLVTSDIPDDCVAAGRPAKVIRMLVK